MAFNDALESRSILLAGVRVVDIVWFLVRYFESRNGQISVARDV